MRRLAAIFAVLAALHPAAAFAVVRAVEAGGWALEAPFELRPLRGVDGQIFKQEVGDPYHSLVLNVRGSWTVDWSESERALAPEGRTRILMMQMIVGLMAERAAVAETPLAPESRFASIEVVDLPPGARPEASVCGGFGWRAEDVGVPGRGEEVHLLRGYEFYCADFVDGSSHYHVMTLTFSERYCAGMGHEPLAEFEDMARRIFASVKFRAGPPHRLSDEPDPGAMEGFGGALSLGPSTLETLPAPACGG